MASPGDDIDPDILRRAFDGDFESIHRISHITAAWTSRGEGARAVSLLSSLCAHLEVTNAAPRSRSLALFALGSLYLQLSRSYEAANAFRAAHWLLSRGQGDAELRLACQANAALALADAGVPDATIAADPLIQNTLYYPPTQLNDKATFFLGVIYFASGWINTAKRYWTEVIRSSAEIGLRFNAKINIANLQLQAGELDEAGKTLQEIQTALPALQDEPDFLVVKADLQIAQKKWDAAETTVREAQAKDVVNADLIYRLGYIAAGREDMKEAERRFEQTIAMAPAHAKAHIGLARTQMKGLNQDQQDRADKRRETMLGGKGGRLGLAGALAFVALLFLLVPMFVGPDKVLTDRKIETSCAIEIKDDNLCPAASITGSKVTLTQKTDSRPRAIPSEHYALAGALGAAALVILLLPYVGKIDAGPISIESLPAPTPQVAKSAG